MKAIGYNPEPLVTWIIALEKADPRLLREQHKNIYDSEAIYGSI